MRSRIILGLLLVFGALATGTIATSGDGVAPARQWALVKFTDPVLVSNQLLMGTYLIKHDDAKMARGEACTTFYRFDKQKGPQEEAVSFHCIPATKQVVNQLTVTKIDHSTMGFTRVTEYQFAGDCEAHGIPLKP